MTTDDQESAETPCHRVQGLSDDECRIVLTILVTSILAIGNTRRVPDILHAARLLSQFEVYTADAAWTDLEDAIRGYRF